MPQTASYNKTHQHHYQFKYKHNQITCPLEALQSSEIGHLYKGGWVKGTLYFVECSNATELRDNGIPQNMLSQKYSESLAYKAQRPLLFANFIAKILELQLRIKNIIIKAHQTCFLNFYNFFFFSRSGLFFFL